MLVLRYFHLWHINFLSDADHLRLQETFGLHMPTSYLAYLTAELATYLAINLPAYIPT